MPLFGIPFAVKDNIDAVGFETTAGCREFRYTPTRSATAVALLEQAGAVLLGKTNLDQFATGLAVKGFICEGNGLEGARDITHFGSWRRYCESQTTA